MPHVDRQLSTTERHPGPTCSHSPSFEAWGNGCYSDRPVIAILAPLSDCLENSTPCSSPRNVDCPLPSCRLLVHAEKQGSGIRKGYPWLESHMALQH